MTVHKEENKMMNLKVGVMPGKLVEVAVEEGTSARRIFEIANVEVNNHEIRLDGAKINIDDAVEEGRLLVAMKMIKGNMPSIKVGIMPGRLQIVEYTVGEKAIDIFNRADVTVSNHEVRLDGNKISLEDEINEGNLLVAMKMIKGNAKVFNSSCTDEEIEILLEQALPHELNANDVTYQDDIVIVKVGNSEVMIDRDMFDSVYEMKDIPSYNNESEVDWEDELFTPSILPEVTKEEKCECSKAKELIKSKLEEEEAQYKRWLEVAYEYKSRADMLKEILEQL